MTDTPGLSQLLFCQCRHNRGDSMDNELDELMEQFMEGMNVKKAIEIFLQSFQGKHALVSRQMLIELGGRVDAAKSEEEKKRIIEKFLKDVVNGEITLYH